LLVFGAASPAGSAVAPKRVDPADSSLSVVFGCFNMRDAPSSFTGVWLPRPRTGADPQRQAVRPDYGVSYHVGVMPGIHRVERFGGSGGIPLLTTRPLRYHFPAKVQCHLGACAGNCRLFPRRVPLRCPAPDATGSTRMLSTCGRRTR
jgi:hypothetical protein